MSASQSIDDVTRRASLGPRTTLRTVATAAGMALFAASLLAFGFGLEGVAAGVFCTALVAVSVTDIERRIIPNRIVLPAALVVLAGMTAATPSPEWALAAIGAAAFLLVAAIIRPQGLGMGDVKLALLLGAGLGRGVTIALIAGLVLASAYGLLLMARHGGRARKLTIPLGPFLSLGGIVALFAPALLGHA